MTREGMLTFDKATGRRLEAMYSTSDVIERRRTAMEAAGPRAGDHGLDIGPGPGFMACELAERVGPDGRIAAVDTNGAMLEMTRRRAEQRGLIDRLDLREADAAALPFPDASLDFVVAIQVYEYVPDIDRALAECVRVLRPGGRLAIVDTDWDTLILQAGADELTTRVIRAWDGHLAHRTLPRRLPGLLRQAGLTLDSAAALPVVDTAYDPTRFGTGLIGLISDYARDRAGVTSAEVDGWLVEIERQAANGGFFFSLNQYCFRATLGPQPGPSTGAIIR
jgi:SAM-dependent methyltransferase